MIAQSFCLWRNTQSSQIKQFLPLFVTHWDKKSQAITPSTSQRWLDFSTKLWLWTSKEPWKNSLCSYKRTITSARVWTAFYFCQMQQFLALVTCLYSFALCHIWVMWLPLTTQLKEVLGFLPQLKFAAIIWTCIFMFEL